MSETAETRTPDQTEQRARELLDEMSLEEKIAQMSGDQTLLTGGVKLARFYNAEPIPSGRNDRLDISALQFTDGPRGVVVRNSTCFPVAMARGASWDVALEERVGDAIGVETRAQGANYFAGVCINLLRHPGWGRAQETYGEDPHHLGEMGAALTRGVQRHAMACVKHFACNSIEHSRLYVNVSADERTLHEVYLPHFRRCVEAGAASVMSAYNRVNGEYCGHNRHLLTDILRNEWGFRGFVMSDFFWGIYDGKAAALAGLDVEMPFTLRFGRKLRRLVRRGEVPVKAIDEAVLRILSAKLRFRDIGEPARYTPEAIAGPEHRALAREAAEQSAVLLKNEPVGGAAGDGAPVLPIADDVQSIAVIGRLAAAENTGDGGSSMVRPPSVVTPLQGLRARAGDRRLEYDDGADAAAAARVAAACAVAIVVAGYTYADEGEYIKRIPFVSKAKGGDRRSLTLSPDDEALILAVAAANPRTVVVIEGGSAIITETWREAVPAIMMAWYPGMEGGHAIARLLFGDVNPSGRLPCVFPRSTAQLPPFDPDADQVTYDRYHGYRLADRDGHDPAFAFGYGLSYTSFELDDLRVASPSIDPDDSWSLSATVRNTGSRAGATVVQLYAGHAASTYDRPGKELKGFVKIHLEPGEERTVALTLPAHSLAVRDGGWVVEPGPYRIWIGLSSRSEDLIEVAGRVEVSGAAW